MASNPKSVSSSTPSTTYARNVTLPPPPTFPKSYGQVTRSVAPNTTRSRMATSGSTPPVFVSNDELLSMFAMVKDQIKQ